MAKEPDFTSLKNISYGLIIMLFICYLNQYFFDKPSKQTMKLCMVILSIIILFLFILRVWLSEIIPSTIIYSAIGGCLLMFGVYIYKYTHRLSNDDENKKEGLENMAAEPSKNIKKIKKNNSSNEPIIANELIAKEPTFQDPGLNQDPVYLATVNAGNINVLKKQVDRVLTLNQQVQDMDAQIKQNTKGIITLTAQFSNISQDLTGRDPNSKEPLPEITGI